MFMLSPISSALLLAASSAAPSALEILEAGDSCYDAALVGRILETRDFLDLNDVLRAEPDQLYLGGISSALVRRDAQLDGRSSELGWVRIVLTSQPLRTTKVLLLTKARPSDVPTVVHFQTLLRGAGKAEFKRALKDAPVERCR